MTKRDVMKMSDSEVVRAVKIAGTDYDRRRKVTKQMITKMEKMLKTGKKTVSQVADHFGVTVGTVKYNTDPIFREMEIARRYNYEFNPSKRDLHEVADYKRALVMAGKKLSVTI